MTKIETVSEYASANQIDEQRFSGRGSLIDLVRELKRQQETKLDFVADTRHLAAVAVDPVAGRDAVVEYVGENDRITTPAVGAKPGRLRLDASKLATSGKRLAKHVAGFSGVSDKVNPVREFIGDDGLDIKPQALSQIASKTSPETPPTFLRKLTERKPQIASGLVNGLWDDPARRLVRCLDGSVRAFLSDKYRVIDNHDLAFAALDAVQKNGGEVIECQLTDKNMRLKFTSRQIFDKIEEARQAPESSWYSGGMGSQRHLSKVMANSREALPGTPGPDADTKGLPAGPGTVHPLVTISNSETGHGGLAVRVGLLRAICFNLATVEDVAVRVHLGSRLEMGMYTAETIAADSTAIWLKCRDAIAAAFSPDKFAELVEMAQAAQGQKLTDPKRAVSGIVKNTDLTEDVEAAILQHFLRDYDLTAYGLAQAISRTAQDITDADKSNDLENVAGMIIKCPTMAVPSSKLITVSAV